MTMKYIDYRIIETPDLEKTCSEVNVYLLNGWVPIGGVAVSTPSGNNYYAQAMAFPNFYEVKNAGGDQQDDRT